MKPTYKISASLLNSYIYYLNNPTDKNYNSLVNHVRGIFETNKYLERGLKFEDEVFEGKHGKLSQLLKDLPKQVWANRKIIREDYDILISGKLDALDKDKGRIYDVKRVTSHTHNKYDDSMQHILYFYIMPEINEFYYLVASGNDKLIKNDVVLYKRPDEKTLEETVMHMIDNFYAFLRQKNLWKDYTEFQKAKNWRKTSE